MNSLMRAFRSTEVAETMRQGVSAHLEEFSPEDISVLQPMNRAGQRLIDSLSETMPITSDALGSVFVFERRVR